MNRWISWSLDFDTRRTRDHSCSRQDTYTRLIDRSEGNWYSSTSHAYLFFTLIWQTNPLNRLFMLNIEDTWVKIMPKVSSNAWNESVILKTFPNPMHVHQWAFRKWPQLVDKTTIALFILLGYYEYHTCALPVHIQKERETDQVYSVRFVLSSPSSIFEYQMSGIVTVEQLHWRQFAVSARCLSLFLTLEVFLLPFTHFIHYREEARKQLYFTSHDAAAAVAVSPLWVIRREKEMQLLLNVNE